MTLPAPEPFLLLPDRSRAAPLIESALAVHGGQLAGDGQRDQVKGTLVSLDELTDRSPSELESIRERFSGPLFLFRTEPATAGTEEIQRVIELLAGLKVELGDARPGREYSFAEDDELWPFSGMSLREQETRTLTALAPPGDARQLIRSEAGCVLLAFGSRDRPIFASLVPLPESHTGPLKREFNGSRFAALLPLMLFARVALGDAAWRTPEARACFIVDDANLRRPRYGFLDYRALLESAKRHRFHLALAMIPLDYRKTSRAGSELMRASPDYLSLVMHGVDHWRGEFEREVSPDDARAALAQGLLRMADHRSRTGIDHANAITFPHGLCNAMWMEAMRDAGFDAAIASRAFPFKPEDELVDPLYELHPAEMSFRGFPVINRFKAEEPKENLLFQAWLGKPLFVYTHHEFFRDGLDRVTEIAEFLNRHVEPQWAGVGSIVRSNYQTRPFDDGSAVRVFSNHVSLSGEHASGLRSLSKPARDVPRDESASANGAEASLEPNRNLGTVASGFPRASGTLEITFGPSQAVTATGLRRPALQAQLRRLATETRDQAVLPLAARFSR